MAISKALSVLIRFNLVEVADGIDEAEQVWDGDTYDEAKRVANAIAADRGGLPIIDKVTA